MTCPTPEVSHTFDYYSLRPEFLSNVDVATVHSYYTNYQNPSSCSGSESYTDWYGGGNGIAVAHIMHDQGSYRYLFITEANSGPWCNWNPGNPVPGPSTLDPNEAANWQRALLLDNYFVGQIKGISFFTAYDTADHGSLVNGTGYDEQKIGGWQAGQIVADAP